MPNGFLRLGRNSGVSFAKSGLARGSALILVLWFLVLMGFLVETYLSQNRAKAVISFNGLKFVKQQEAVNSVIEFMGSYSTLVMTRQEEHPSGWLPLKVGDTKVWVKAESEGAKVNLNNGSDAKIRDQVLSSFGEEYTEEAEQLSDSILDWRDPDNMTRTFGAEKDFYQSKGLPYVPADGPFKVLTELLLVRGVTPGLFWGDPLEYIISTEKKEQRQETEPEEGKNLSPLCEIFTIYDKDVKRLAIIVPGRGKSYLYALVFFKQERGGKLVPIQRCQTVLTRQVDELPEK